MSNKQNEKRKRAASEAFGVSYIFLKIYVPYTNDDSPVKGKQECIYKTC